MARSLHLHGDPAVCCQLLAAVAVVVVVVVVVAEALQQPHQLTSSPA